MSKKFLAKLLIFCMVFTMMPFSVFATDEPTAQADDVYTVNFDTSNPTKITAGDEAGVTLTVKDIVYSNQSDTEMTGYTFAWSSNNNDVSVTGNGKTAKVVADAQATGTAEISVTVTKDGGQGVAKTTLTVEAAEVEEVKITFDGNGGTISGDNIVTISKGAAIGTLPVPTKEGYTFNGWFTAATDGDKVTENTTFDADTTIYAQWTKNEEEATITKVTVTPITTTLVVGGDEATVQLIATVTGTGAFDKTVIWSSSDPAVATVDENGIVTAVKEGSATITATAKGNSNIKGTSTITVKPEGTSVYTVTFDTDGGSLVADQKVEAGKTATEPNQPTKSGFDFAGWYAKDATEPFDFTTPINDNITLVAKWTKKVAVEYTVTFMDEDKVVGTVKTVDSKVEIMPYANKEGYAFLGWFDAKEGGNKITAATVFTKDTTVYAQWAELEIIKIICNPEKVTAVADKAGKKIVVTGNVGADEEIALYCQLGYMDGNEPVLIAVTSEGIKIDYVEGKFVANPAKVTVGITEYTVDLSGLKLEQFVTVTPEISVDVPANATDAEKATAEAAKGTWVEGIQNAVSAAKTENADGSLTIGSTTVSAKAIADAVKELAAPEGLAVKTVVVPRLSIKVAAELKFDITVVADVRVTTDDKNMVLEGAGRNTINVEEGIPVTVEKEVSIYLPLAKSVLNLSNYNKNLFVKHTKSNGKVYRYLAYKEIWNGGNAISFTNPNGFSEFEIDKDFNGVAVVDGVAYETLQAAVDAVADNGRILLLQDGTATVGKTITFTVVEYVQGVKATITAGTNTEVNTDNVNANGIGTYVFTYKGGGSSGGGGSSNNVSIATKVTGGKVTVTPTRPTRGQTVTITVAPAEGYKLDTLTVTDLKGNTIELTKVSDTKYTFVMPAGKVKITPSFVKVDGSDKKDETTNVNKRFSDVEANAWYAEYINYVAENGLMNGYENGTFGPNDKTTRAQIVTVLFRMEGEPAVSASSKFSDVSAGGQYYSSAVTWAARNNIVNGYEDGRFGPNDNVTREQIAAILFRYAEYKGYDTSLAGNVASFNDAAKVSSWATNAISWAIGEGLMNGDNGALRPQGNATRAEIAALLMRFSENIAK